MAKHPTPLLDELEKGPWPSFVTALKKQAETKPECWDLLGQLELSYKDRITHWKHGGIVGVFGYGGGVLFIPAPMVRMVIDSAEKSHCKDLFGFEMIKQGVYQTADIDIDYWPKSVLDRLAEFIRTDPRAAQYRDLDWTEEYEEARKFYGE